MPVSSQYFSPRSFPKMIFLPSWLYGYLSVDGLSTGGTSVKLSRPAHWVMFARSLSHNARYCAFYEYNVEFDI